MSSPPGPPRSNRVVLAPGSSVSLNRAALGLGSAALPAIPPHMLACVQRRLQRRATNSQNNRVARHLGQQVRQRRSGLFLRHGCCVELPCACSRRQRSCCSVWVRLQTTIVPSNTFVLGIGKAQQQSLAFSGLSEYYVRSRHITSTSKHRAQASVSESGRSASRYGRELGRVVDLLRVLEASISSGGARWSAMVRSRDETTGTPLPCSPSAAPGPCPC